MSLRTVAHWVVDVIFVCAAIVMIVGLVVDGVQARSVAGAIAQLLIAVVIALLWAGSSSDTSAPPTTSARRSPDRAAGPRRPEAPARTGPSPGATRVGRPSPTRAASEATGHEDRSAA